MKIDLTKQFSEQEAIEFGKSGAWKEMTHRQRTALQLFQRLMCMPFNAFHESIEAALGRPVYTHEMGSSGMIGLKQELLGLKRAPSIEEIIDLIPEDKRIILIK